MSYHVQTLQLFFFNIVKRTLVWSSDEASFLMNYLLLATQRAGGTERKCTLSFLWSFITPCKSSAPLWGNLFLIAVSLINRLLLESASSSEKSMPFFQTRVLNLQLAWSCRSGRMQEPTRFLLFIRKMSKDWLAFKLIRWNARRQRKQTHFISNIFMRSICKGPPLNLTIVFGCFRVRIS